MQPLAATGSRSFGGWGVVIGALLLFVLMAFSPAQLNDGDTWWHIRAGEWILQHRAVPQVDPFAGEGLPRAWVAHEWLAEVLFALAHRWGGVAGVMLLTALACALAMALLGRRLERDLDELTVLCGMTIAFVLMAPGFLARPHVLALPVLVAWTVALLEARDRDVVPSFWLVPLMALWANLHGGFAFGIALAGFFGLEALLGAPAERRAATFRGWLLFGGAIVLAALATPHGVGGLLFPFQLLRMKSLSLIDEWRPVAFEGIVPLELLLLGLLFLLMRVPVKLSPMRILLLLLLVHMALHQRRHAVLLAVVGLLVLAEAVGRALNRTPLPGEVGSGPPRPVLAVAFAAGLFVAGMARMALPVTLGDARNVPATALAAVPTELRGKPVLNGYDFGGYLIWNGISPWIDGRTDMYGDERMFAYDRLTAPDAGFLAEVLNRDRIAWTVFPPGGRIVGALDALPGWKRLVAGPFAVVHVRESGAALP